MNKHKPDLRGCVPETWNCVDCDINTHPGNLNTREEWEKALAFARATHNETIATITFDEHSEVYMVKPAVWAAASMGEMDGCLCIGCLEKRLGRTLLPKDFSRNHPFNRMPGTERLLSRRDGEWIAAALHSTSHKKSFPICTSDIVAQ
jgi:hypothetical protein